MNAVRYYSRSGNTKLVAEKIADAIGEKAVSVDQANAKITEPVDVLFIGGALYAYGIDAKLKRYIAGIDAKKVKKAVVFSTSWISKHSIDLIKKGLSEKGIPVEEEYFYVKNKANEQQLKDAAEFAKKMSR